MIGMMDDEQRVKAFFLASPVSPKELKEVGPHVEKALTSIVEQMEEQGPAMYQRFQAQQKRIETQQKEDAATVEESTDALQVDPRSYQRALLEIAKKENTIVHLGTGTGKSKELFGRSCFVRAGVAFVVRRWIKINIFLFF